MRFGLGYLDNDLLLPIWRTHCLYRCPFQFAHYVGQVATWQGMNMKLIIKFNLVLLLVFATGFVVVGYFSNRLLQRNAKQEILGPRVTLSVPPLVMESCAIQVLP